MDLKHTPCCKTIGVFGDGSCHMLAELVHCRNCAEYARAGRELFERPLPQQELDDWTELLGRAKEFEPEGAISAAVFRVLGEWFALKAACLQEIADAGAMHSVPFRSGKSFRGLANINGELLLCIDPAQILGLAPQGSGVRRLIVAAKDHQRFALLVEDILGVHRIPPAAISRPPATIAKCPSALTLGLFTLDGKSIGLLDEHLFFDALAGSIAQ